MPWDGAREGLFIGKVTGERGGALVLCQTAWFGGMPTKNKKAKQVLGGRKETAGRKTPRREKHIISFQGSKKKKKKKRKKKGEGKRKK